MEQALPQLPPQQPPPPPLPEDHSSAPGLWVFGYGSLCWHPGFEFDQSLTGYVRGWARRFWQGNTTHRGTEGKPGRVATLVEEKEGVVWGRAFAVRGDAALPYLDTRECRLGGYRTQLATFYPRCCPHRPLAALLYVATPANALWLGDAPLPEMASQIVASAGPSGHNVEYVVRLAEFMRRQVPEAADHHLFQLEKLVRDTAHERRLCVRALVGDLRDLAVLVDSPCAAAAAAAAASSGSGSSDEREPEGAVGGAGGAGPPAPAADPPSFQFTSRVPTKKLRCLNI